MISSAPPPLTARQQKVLDWIRRYLESTGMPPTRAEIAAGLGFSTASSAEDHLRALARKGVLLLTPGASRGLRLKETPELLQVEFRLQEGIPFHEPLRQL